jgi:oligopeptidase B
MRGRIKEDESTPPSPDGAWSYWVKYREGGEYPIFVRAPRHGGEEQILFDGDAERGEAKFFNIADIEHSPDHRLIAHAVDRLGSEYYAIGVRDLETGKDLPDVIESADDCGAVWSADSAGFFYVERDARQRPARVKYHRLGQAQKNDKLVYEEEDASFFLSIAKSQSAAYVFIAARSHITSEARYIPADAPDETPRLIAARETGVEYDVEHHDGEFFIRTNADGAVDFKIVKTPISDPGRAHWRDWVSHRSGRFILDIIPYKEYFVRVERSDALPQLVVSDYQGTEHAIAFDEAVYAVSAQAGFEYDTEVLRFAYSSPAAPRQIFDYNMKTRRRGVLKTQTVPSGHDPSLYEVERVAAPAADGARIPITILRLKSTPKDGSAPLLLYGYGAYGITIPAGFSTDILSLVDRGAVYAIAHIRGGAAKGRQWHLDGKLENKKNSFSDFIASAETLVAQRYASEKRIVIYGGSAGGLLLGACINQRPDLFAGVIAAVPFVDVLNTISDSDLPLTPPEWEEWGNPIKSAEQYGWIADYSPYDNIRGADYPPIMATGGLTDFRVTYWEPAKWIARLRAEARGGPFLLRMNMGAGHAGSAARFERLDEEAHLFAFALKVMGLEDKAPVKHK